MGNPTPPVHTHQNSDHHWQHIYNRRRQRALGISTKQMAWSQVFSLVGSVVAGALLESNKTTLALLAGTFVVLPGVFDLTGTLGAALSAKINHKLENPSARPWRVFFKTIFFDFFMAVTAGLIVAFVGATISTIFFDASFIKVFLLAEIAIILGALIGLPLIGLLSLLFRRLRINPDDVVGPIESSVFDILTVITMALVVSWLI